MMNDESGTDAAQSSSVFDVVVIGAGIAGLSAATTLIEAGLRVLVLDKGRGVGGRMATRRANADGKQWVWDHGAQFIRFRSPQLQRHSQAWQAQGLLDNWLTRLPQYASPSQVSSHPDEVTRFKGVRGMTTLPKALSQAIQEHPLGEIRCGVRVTGLGRVITAQGTCWQLETEQQPEQPIQARALLLTAPVPQTLALLQTCPDLMTEALQPLEAITYSPCISLLLGFSEADPIQSLPLLQHGALQWMDHPILGWFGDNHQKGVSPDPAWTLQANESWSSANWDADDETVRQAMLNALEEVLGQSLPPVAYTSIMRWRYSIPVKTYPAPYACVSEQAMIWVAGDAFENPEYGAKRIEGAYLSGQAAARAIVQHVRPSSG